jgi:hypothetical protein
MDRIPQKQIPPEIEQAYATHLDHIRWPWQHALTVPRREDHRPQCHVACWPCQTQSRDWLSPSPISTQKHPIVTLNRRTFAGDSGRDIETYWIGQCPDCGRVYWADVEDNQ